MPGAQTILIEVKDVHGTYRLLPLISPPQFSIEHHMSSDIPITKVSNVDFEIRRLLVVDAQGNPVSEYMGPFPSSSTFQHQAAPKPVAKPATKVLLEFEGEQHWLSVGDEFNLKYNLEVPQELLVTVDPNTLLNNFITQKKVTIKDITGDSTKVKINGAGISSTYTAQMAATTSNTMWYAINPDAVQGNKKWSELIETTIKQDWTGIGTWDETVFKEGLFPPKKMVPHSEFNHVWIEKKQCYVISGFDGNNRYEIILGTPVDSVVGFFHNILNVNVKDAPTNLHELITNLNRSFKAKLGTGQDEFLRHPGLRQKVSCPTKVEEDINCPYYHPSQPSTDDLQTMIIHLNDNHRWTREAIAEWIDTLEDQPVFYPKPQLERVANSAKVVALKPPVPKAPKH
jgi:hypothetical protein